MANCPNFHGLKQFNTPDTSYKCDGCEKTVAQNDKIWRCRLCDYDLCLNCYNNYIKTYSHLINMGFSDYLALKAASQSPNNIDKAAEWIDAQTTKQTDTKQADTQQNEYDIGFIKNKVKTAINGLDSLDPYKDIIIEYIQLNYTDLLQKDTKTFSNAVANHCGNKKLYIPLTKLYKKIFIDIERTNIYRKKQLNANIKQNTDKSAYNRLLSNFMNFCEIINATENIKIAKWDKLSKQQVIICSLLSKWIYDPKHYKPILNNTNLSIKSSAESKGNEITKWSFLVNQHLKIGYIVFRGTASGEFESLGVDVLTDISIIPTPIWVDDARAPDEKHQSGLDWIDKTRNKRCRFDFAVHSGIYSAVLRTFGSILAKLHEFNTLFDELYVTGHSLGGGLAILFGLELLLKDVIPTHIKCSIVTFGSPQVISLENKIIEHNEKSKVLLSRLHSMTHCFINKFDIVPRVPSQWILEILLPEMPKILKSTMSSGFIMDIGINMYAAGYINQLRDSFIKHQEILNTFQSFGTVYILLHDKDKNVYVIDDAADTRIIKHILSFIPPVERCKQEFNGEQSFNYNYILAHYYYKYALFPINEYVEQTQLLMKQKYLEFEDKIYEIKATSNEYAKIQKYLFSKKDWLHLLFDHYIDNYLHGLIKIPEDNNNNILDLKLEFIKLFENGEPCGSGSTLWNDFKVFNDKELGQLKLQSHGGNDKHEYVKKLTTMVRHIGYWSNHADPFRIILKSNIFTRGQWKELYHSKDFDELFPKYKRAKQAMSMYLDSKIINEV